jgi:hypothetical protein
MPTLRQATSSSTHYGETITGQQQSLSAEDDKGNHHGIASQ